jgi:hypothetical protein
MLEADWAVLVIAKVRFKCSELLNFLNFQKSQNFIFRNKNEKEQVFVIKIGREYTKIIDLKTDGK